MVSPESNHTAEFEFTVIVPVFNEQDNIVRLEKELNDFKQKLASARETVISQENELNEIKRELNDIKDSLTFRTAKKVTAIPRMIKIRIKTMKRSS